MPTNPIFGSGQPGSVAGVSAVPPWGQREQFLFFSKSGFGSALIAGDTWTTVLTTTEGDITIGSGQLQVDSSGHGLSPTFPFTYRNRVYLANGSQFNFSDNGDPTEWEQQGAGAGFIPYLSYFGSQDQVVTINQLQGRLAVFGERSIQIWTADADPANFALVQEMDNIGTKAPLSAQNIGDYDVIFLDVTGYRSLRQREVTQNAYVDDVGIPIDSLVEDDLVTANPATCCSIVDPSTKRFMSYLNGKIYVLSRYPSSKISAWSTYDPKDSNGLAFVPQKFIVFNGIVYCRTADNRLISLGGNSGIAYDGSVLTVELPWLDDKQPKLMKYSLGVDIACAGQWQLYLSMDPTSFAKTESPPQLAYYVPATTGDESADSSFDLQRIAFQQRGTHFKLLASTSPSWGEIATLSELQFHYNKGNDI